MKVDDSFKKPGAVPFKWEVRPGVPKIRQSQIHDHHLKCDEFHHHHHQQLEEEQSAKSIHNTTFPENPPKLKPPPAGFNFQPPMEPRTHSFRSSPRTRSNRFGMPAVLARPDIVSSGGCFPSPLVKRKNGKKTAVKPGSSPESEPESAYSFDFDTPSRLSVSSRRSVSPLSSSFASYQSSPRPVSPWSSSFASPRPVSDAEWATIGLF